LLNKREKKIDEKINATSSVFKFLQDEEHHDYTEILIGPNFPCNIFSATSTQEKYYITSISAFQSYSKCCFDV
jgi:hypothetical protein